MSHMMVYVSRSQITEIVPDVFRILVQSEQVNFRVTFTQMIGTTDRAYYNPHKKDAPEQFPCIFKKTQRLQSKGYV